MQHHTCPVHPQKMDCSEEYTKMEMECEPNKSFRRGRPCSRKTGILLLLGTVCMIIFLIMTSVIFSHQERKFSALESWMNSHTSDLTAVKSDVQISGNDLEKKVSELQDLVSSLSSYLNMSEPSKSLISEMREKLSNIETLMTDHGSSKHEENLQKLENSLKAAIASLRSYSLLHHISIARLSSLTDLEDLRSSIRTLSYKLSFANLLMPGCPQRDWIPFSNSCYLFSRDTMNWNQSKDYCEKQGAFLLKIEDGSEEEWEFVTGFITAPFYWVGLTDQNTGEWRWADDTPYTMNKEQWSPGQPDDWTEHGFGEEGEDCGHITYDKKLNDAHCSAKMNYICKK